MKITHKQQSALIEIKRTADANSDFYVGCRTQELPFNTILKLRDLGFVETRGFSTRHRGKLYYCVEARLTKEGQALLNGLASQEEKAQVAS